MIHFKIGALRLTGRLLMASMFLVAGLARIASTHVVTAGHVASDGPPMDNMVAVFLGSFEVAAACTLAFDLRTPWVALGCAAYFAVDHRIVQRFWAGGRGGGGTGGRLARRRAERAAAWGCSPCGVERGPGPAAVVGQDRDLPGRGRTPGNRERGAVAQG